MSTVDFKRVVAAAGIPTTDAELLAKWREIAVEEGAILNNTCEISPFWRLVTALVTKPVMWLLELLWGEIMPGLFLKTAMGMESKLWVELFAYQLGLTRKVATKARGAIIFSRATATNAVTIKQGTVIQSPAINGRVYRLRTVADAVMTAGILEFAVVAEAEESGSAYNLATGFYALMSTPLAGIVSVRNASDWLLVPGADEETNLELGERCRNQFAAVNQWHIDAAYIAMVTKWAGVAVSDVYIEHDAPRGDGTANIYIMFDFDLPASEYIAAMQAYIMTDGNHGLGDDVLIMPMPTYPLDVTATVVLSPTLTDAEAAELTSNIGLMIRVALRALPPTDFQPTRVAPYKRFAWSRLIRELHNQFAGLESVDFASDVDLIPHLALPQLRSLTVEVVA